MSPCTTPDIPREETPDCCVKACGTMGTRRSWLVGVLALSAASIVRTARAAPARLQVAAPSNAVAAIVAAVGEDDVEVSVDAGLGATKVRVGDGSAIDVGKGLLLKGKGSARGRYLDDARNAPKLGANVREALGKADAARASRFADNYRAWSRPFARKVLRWQSALAKSVVRGKRIRDQHGRAYLLEWAGASVDAKAGKPGPAALGKLPDGPGAATMAAYEAYVARLVKSLTP